MVGWIHNSYRILIICEVNVESKLNKQNNFSKFLVDIIRT